MASKKAKTTTVKAHKRKVTPKKKIEPKVEIDEEGPLPDDPDNEVDQRASAAAQDFEQAVVTKRRNYRKLTQAKVMAALQESSGIISQAAEALGVSRTGLNDFIKKEPRVQQFLTEVRDEVMDACKGTILMAIMSGQVSVAQWYLGRMDPQFADKHQHQALGADGRAVDIRERIINARPMLKPDAPIPANPVL